MTTQRRDSTEQLPRCMRRGVCLPQIKEAQHQPPLFVRQCKSTSAICEKRTNTESGDLPLSFAAGLGDDQYVLTVDPYGAAVSRGLLRGLAGAGFAPLLQLLFELLCAHDGLPIIIVPHLPSYTSINASKLFARAGLRSFRKALASIWRIRSRVTAKRCPTSSNV